MDGKIFLNSNGTPPRIAFSPAFAFDLQRFVFSLEATEKGDTHVFSVKKGENTYYGTADEFTTANLTESGITEINLFGDVTLADNVGSDSSKVAATINVTENATLDLNGKTLTTSADKGIKIADGVTFQLNDSGTGGTGGTINHTAYTDSSSAKENRKTKAAIWVGSNDSYSTKNATKATFTMLGGKITSKGISVGVHNNSEINIQSGTIESTNSSAIYFDASKDDKTIDCKMTMSGGTLKSTGFRPTIQVSGNFANSTNESSYTGNVEIDITGGSITYEDAKNTPAKDEDISKGAVFISGRTVLNIEDGATITSSHVGIEFRAGTLNVKGGTIESTTKVDENTQVGFHSTTAGTSFEDGVAIAISKSSTQRKIEANISGGTISGYAALAVANTNITNTATTTVNVTGGTLESTAPSTTQEGITTSQTDNGGGTTVTQYNLKGKNAILNLDKDVTVNLSGTKVLGSVAAVMKGRTDNTNGYEIGTGNTFSNFTFPDNNSKLVSFYKVTGSTENFTVNVLGANQNWNRNTQNPAENTWVYIVSSGSGEGAVATLAPATGDDETTVLKLTTATSEGTTIPLDLTAKTFEELTTFTTLDASAATNNFALNITGNETITAITGGKGNDTLTAVNTKGVTLNGGDGDDSLIGGDGKDTFIFSGGSDTIQDYVYGTDAVSLGTDFKLPTSFASINNSDSSNFVLAVGNAASLTFRPIAELQIAQNGDTYSYTSKSIALDKKDSHGISLGAGWTSDFNGTKEAYENYTTIDAKEVKTAIKITGNDNANSIVGGKGGGTLLGGDNDDTLVAGGGSTTLNGGEGDDVLKGGSGKDLFIYTEGTDSIGNYTANGDLISVRGVNLAEATVSKDTGTNNDLILTFDSSNALKIADGASADDSSAISIQSGKRTYLFTAGSIALDKSITLTSDFAGTSFDKGDAYDTINAAAVTKNDISINGNDNANYLVGSTDKKNTLDGGKGNDTLVGGTVSAEDTFIYSAGKDVIENFNATDDKLSITEALIGSIESGKATSNKLTFTINNKSDVLTFNFGDSDIDSVSVEGGGYLTKDGYAKSNAVSLFSSAKGNITVGGTGLYSGVSTVDATKVEKQGVTLAGGGGLYKFNGSNKQKDGFTYVGGTVSITGYEGGKDRIDLGAASISNFAIENNNDVVLNLGESSRISIQGAKNKEVFVRQSGSNSFQRMVFVDTGVVQTKATKPTAAVISSAPSGDTYNAPSTVKKVSVDVGGVKVVAGDSKNTVLDASGAPSGVSLQGGKKNDRLIGSDFEDTFIYSAGKDVILNYNTNDNISLESDLYDKIPEAKITASSKSIKFKFDNKNTLTVKAEKGTTFTNGQLQINGMNYTYLKNAVQNDGGTVSLTSSFSGTFKTSTSDTTQTEIDGHLVKNNLTFVGSTRNEKFIGSDENKKTTFKGGGGNDTLVGGASKDTFFYAKSYTGDAVIQSFDFKNDKLKVASGKIGNISKEGNNITIGMTNGQKNSSAIVGSFKITSQKPTEAGGEPTDITGNVAFKANNTYYWFAEEGNNYVSADDGTTAITPGQLITKENRLSALPTDLSGASVIDLNYSTNLVKSGVAVKVTGATPKPKT